ncbi:ATP-binding protein [Novosphingobium sp. BW1]|uniref:ATP-binding protein n=1 Tax=Novosphingobium sp. BW1 TaxID=2592621 RepID=UPI0011DE7B64|nr:ATP-binding protein [Novosphingobium sp. BW1]TYC78782.1 ATP-binding protein [Novosphingobium sp. BW1]
MAKRAQFKVVYLGRSSRRAKGFVPGVDGDALELLENDWDDYGNRTSFGTICRIGGEEVELGAIKLMVDGQDTTATYLDKLRKDGWDGEFPIPKGDYISVPNEITFYEQLVAQIELDGAKRVAKVLRDASYLVNIEEDARAIAQIDTSPFRKSLQRERGGVKSFLDGWKLFARQAMDVMDLGFQFRDVFGEVSTLELHFAAKGLLPRDVNVLIGPNGSGKSQLLHQIVQDWLGDTDEERDTGFIEKPNLSQLVVVSYSPFEQFPVDLRGVKKQDQDAYRYFGFRGRSTPQPGTKRLGGIRLTHEAPKRNAATSLLDCLSDDKRYRSLPGWPQKLKTMERVLRTAFDFDFAAVTVETPKLDPKRYYLDHDYVDQKIIEDDDLLNDRHLIAIDAASVNDLVIDTIREDLVASEGVTFVKDKRPIELSSGQKLFSFIVVNILGAIRRDSLILIDEPELFLHPTLEIRFIGMLKRILQHFNSKALMATHSVVTVREVPSDCVHVFERTDAGLVVKRPPFETFGGDIQRITSYVFGDNATSKPYEGWIREQLEELGDADALIAALGEELNEELIVQIRAMDNG